jgi:hypothetical protein
MDWRDAAFIILVASAAFWLPVIYLLRSFYP